MTRCPDTAGRLFPGPDTSLRRGWGKTWDRFPAWSQPPFDMAMQSEWPREIILGAAGDLFVIICGLMRDCHDLLRL